MTRTNNMVWIFLMLLTGASFALGEQRVGGSLVLLVAGMKFSLVAWHFMDLRRAALIWKVALASLAGAILAMAALLD